MTQIAILPATSTNPDRGAIAKLLSDPESFRTCQICGSKQGFGWGHYDTWSKWLGLRGGCNVNYCDACKDKVEEVANALLKDSSEKVRAEEVAYLKSTKPGSVAMIRAKFFNDWNCGDEFRTWVVGHVGQTRADEILNINCDQCHSALGPPKKFFEDTDGNQSLKSVYEISDFVCEKLGLPKGTSEIDGLNMSMSMISKYMFDQGWDGWKPKSGSLTDPEYNKRFSEACKVVHATDWSWGNWAYYDPTQTWLCRFRDRGQDGPQILQVNYGEIKKKKEELYNSEQKDDKLWVKFEELENLAIHKYFCCNACKDEWKKSNSATDAMGMSYI